MHVCNCFETSASMELLFKLCQTLLLIVVNSPLCFAGLCNNFLLHSRNITTHVSTSYGFGSPKNLYDPQQALLYTEEKTDSEGRVKIAAWTAGINNKEQYWQVDFESPSIIRGVVTQGRNGCCRQWVTAYKIFRSDDCRTFLPVKHKDGEIWEANNDENSPVTNTFICSVKAKCIRIVPETWHNHIAMRFELLGCPIQPTPPLHHTTYLPTSTLSISNGTTPSKPSTLSSYTDSTTQITMPNIPSSGVETSTARILSSSSASSSPLSSSSSSSSLLTSIISTTSNKNFAINTSTHSSSNVTTSSFVTSVSPIQQSTFLSTSVAVTPGQALHSRSSSESTSSSSHPETTGPGSTATIDFSTAQSACKDKEGVDCSLLNKYFLICKDRVSASTTCPKHCGMCQSSLTTTVLFYGSVTSTSDNKTMSSSTPQNVSSNVSASAITPSISSISTTSSSDISTSTDVSASPYSDHSSIKTSYSTPFEFPSPTTESTMNSITSISMTSTTATVQSTVSEYTNSTEILATTTVSYKVVCAKKNLISSYSCDFENGPCGYNITTNPQLWNIVKSGYGNETNATIQGDHTNSKYFHYLFLLLNH